MSPVGYIAYVDEAGDDGLRNLRTANSDGASEWMVISAVLIKAESEPRVLGWAKEIIKCIDQHQLSQIHYYKLSHDKKIVACSQLALLDVRIFSVLSHKKNMQGYRNTRASQSRVNRTAWFYCWMTKLLLERVSAYCGRRTIKDYGEIRNVRVELSDRGGVKISDVRDYYKYIKYQSERGILHDSTFDIDWSVIDPDEIFTYPNNMRAGLQLADIAASAFFGGLERTRDGSTKPEPAKLLRPRVCLNEANRRYGFGVKLIPAWTVKNLPPEQADLIKFYMNE